MLRSTLATGALLCAAAMFATSATAQSFSYPDFSSIAQLNLLGNTAQSGTALRLTANASNQTGWAWYQNAVPILNGFDTTFTFRITPPPVGVKAEGMALVIHDDPNGANATGGTVWGMGYGVGANGSVGIRNSIAIEIDTYNDGFLNDTSANELTIHTRGAFGNNENENFSIARTTPTINFANGQVHTLRVVYVPGTIEVFVDGAATPALSQSYDLIAGGTYLSGSAVAGIGSTSGTGFAGFCATTGAGTLTEEVEVLSWDWASTPLTDPCYNGTLGADTLTINGDAGDSFRRVEVATHQAFGIELANPPQFGPGAPYLLFATLLPQPGVVGTGLGFGDACLPMLLPGPTELVIADTFGFGSGLLSAQPTPHTIAVPQSVITFPIELTMQAVTFDMAAPLTLGLTNAVELAVVPVGPPAIITVSPLSAAAGASITINGQNFVPGAQLIVGGVPVVPTQSSSNEFVFDYPAGLGCDSSLSVTNPDGQAASAPINPTPTVIGTLLGTGTSAGGAVFIVRGSGFAPGTTVTIGGNAATVNAVAPVIITMSTPPGTPGIAPVIITTPGGCTATTTYTYQ